jgi:poly-gamma-glutamate synthesis protein (capsule biosynthesis protein)
MTFTATGDSFITRILPYKSESFRKVQSLLGKGEARFTNLEVTVHNHEGYPAPFSGGTWAMAPPEVLTTIKDYGFNLIGWANNHTMDYTYGGLEATEKYLNEYGFIHAGAGECLAAASSPKFLECPSGRVAIIAATSTFHGSWIAGEQRRDEQGRPGINPLQYDTKYVISKEQLRQLHSIAEKVEINTDTELQIKEGIIVAPNSKGYQFGNHRFTVGPQTGKKTKPIQRDMDRMERSIAEANKRSDYVIVSIHSHEMKQQKDKPADFLVSFARQCIEMGAHAVIGHGPHVIRGIEIYQKRPIFYSLGDFIFQPETVKTQPYDFYEKYGLGHNHKVTDALSAKSANYTRGLHMDPHVWESIVPMWQMENGQLTELRLYPIELGYDLPVYRRGWPYLSRNTTVLEKIKNLSDPFGTSVIMNGNHAYIDL